MSDSQSFLSRMAGKWTVRQEAPQAAFPSNLKAIVGSFDERLRSSVDQVQAEMILGGTFLQIRFAGEFQGQQFSTTGIVGFDREKQEYVEFWANSLGLVHYVSTSDYEMTATSLRMNHKNIKSADGEVSPSRSVYELIGNDSFSHCLSRVLADGTEKIVKLTHFAKAA
jgi:hypothetical protein